jgi:hypothetical protein
MINEETLGDKERPSRASHSFPALFFFSGEPNQSIKFSSNLFCGFRKSYDSNNAVLAFHTVSPLPHAHGTTRLLHQQLDRASDSDDCRETPSRSHSRGSLSHTTFLPRQRYQSIRVNRLLGLGSAGLLLGAIPLLCVSTLLSYITTSIAGFGWFGLCV